MRKLIERIVVLLMCLVLVVSDSVFISYATELNKDILEESIAVQNENEFLIEGNENAEGISGILPLDSEDGLIEGGLLIDGDKMEASLSVGEGLDIEDESNDNEIEVTEDDSVEEIEEVESEEVEISDEPLYLSVKPYEGATYSLTYTVLSNKTVKITGFSGEAHGDLIIPDKIGGYKVSTIGNSAFDSYHNDFDGKLVLPKSITSIGEYAFWGCDRLTGELVLPEFVTSIEGNAFGCCSGLTGELVLPKSLTSMGEHAFYYCKGLTELVLPESLTSIEKGVFRLCTGLTELELPESITSIGEKAFSDCTGLTKLVLSKSLTSIGLEAFSGCTGLTELELPKLLTSIGQDAFSGCTGLTELVLPESLTSIESGTFTGCTGLTELVLPESITNIGEKAFSGCTGLTELVLPESLTSIGVEAFSGCTGLTELVLPESLTSISDRAFSRCIGLGRVYIGPNARYIVGWSSDSPFYGCNCSIYCFERRWGFSGKFKTGYRKEDYTYWFNEYPKSGIVTIPDGINVIPEFAYNNCTQLTDIYIPASVTIINDGAFKGCKSSTNVYFEGDSDFSVNAVTTVGCDKEAFLYWSSLCASGSIVIPDGISIIPNNAFSNCKNVTDIMIPGSVKRISTKAFSNCSSKTIIYLEKEEQENMYATGWNLGAENRKLVYAVYDAEAQMFWNTIDGVRGKVIIPEGMTYIPHNAFSGSNWITEVYVPASVKIIYADVVEDSPFYGANSNIVIHCEDVGLKQSWGKYWNYYNSSAVIETIYGYLNYDSYYYWNSLVDKSGDLVIPEGIESIPSKAFYNCKELKSVIIPDSVKEIGEYAFAYCEGLDAISISNSVTQIRKGTFSNCTSLKHIELPDSVNSIGVNAFANCNTLKRIFIPSSVDRITASNYADSPFFGCSDECVVICGSSVKNGWGKYWDYYDRYTYLWNTIYDSTREEYDYWNNVNVYVEKVIIPDGITYIPAYAFSDATMLKFIEIPDSIKIIGERAFLACTSLKTIYIPANITVRMSAIKYSPFYQCSDSLKIYYGGGAGPEYLDWIYYSASDELSTTSRYSREDYYNWIEPRIDYSTGIVTLPTGTKYIPDNAFSNNKMLKTLVIPLTVTSIGNGVLDGCSSLIRVENNSTEGIVLPEGDWFYSGDSLLRKIYSVKNAIAVKGEYVATVSFETENQLQIDDIVVKYADEYGELPVPEYENHVFKGWYLDKAYKEQVTSDTKMILGKNHTLYAKWYTKCGDNLLYGTEKQNGKTVLLFEGTGEMPDTEDGLCSDLITDIAFDDRMTSIGANAFKKQTSLQSVTIPEGINIIGNGAFSGCTGLEELIIGGNVTNIGDNAFNGCTGLGELTIGGNVTNIGDNAFNGCIGLSELFVGSNVTSIGKDAFANTQIVLKGEPNSYVSKYAAANNIAFEYVLNPGDLLDVPELESLEHVKVTLVPVSGAEYRVNGSAWVKSNVFENLEPCTEYTFYQRIAKTSKYDATASSKGLKVKTNKRESLAKAPEPKINRIYDTGVSLFTFAGCELSIDGNNWISGCEFTELIPNTEYTIYQRYAETDEYDPGTTISKVVFRTAKSSVVVLLNANGGVFENGLEELQIVTNKDEKAILRIPVKNDAVFVGWETEDGIRYDENQLIEDNMSLYAIWEEGMQIDAPRSNYDSGSTLLDNQKIVLSTKFTGADIFYTLDGTIPNENSIKYVGPFAISNKAGEVVLKAIAIKEGYLDSSINTYKFSIELNKNPKYYGDIWEEDWSLFDEISVGEPDGLWVAGIPDSVTYTGKNISFDLRVYSYNKMLELNKDYTVKYVNNKVVAEYDAKKAPTVVVTGKGNYSGKITKTFSITPVDISTDEDISYDEPYLRYNGKRQFGKPTIYYKGMKLSYGKDFTVEYEDYDPYDYDVDSYDYSMYRGGREEEAIYSIYVTGKGSFEGELVVSEIITDYALISGATVSGVKQYYCTGEGIEQENIVVKYKGVVCDDYFVDYRNNVEPGTAQMILYGSGDFSGIKIVNFKILSNPIKDTVVQFTNVPSVVDGSDFIPDVKVIYPRENNCQLIEGEDYSVSYTVNSANGQRAVKITGIGRFSGTVSKTISVPKYDIALDENNLLNVTYNENNCYVKGGVCPEPVVRFNGVELIKDKDYSVKYKNNNKVASAVADKAKPTIVVTGKGFYKGSKEYTFNIYPKNISTLRVDLVDMAYQDKVGVYNNSPVIIDVDGKKLVANKDYLKTLEYSYEIIPSDKQIIQKIGKVSEVVQRNKGDIVGAKDIIPEGTVIRVKITGTGNYTGVLYGYYRFAKADISKATVKVVNQIYTGNRVEPDKEDISVFIGKDEISADNYIITEYSNNIKKGTAKLIIKGTGDYVGTKVASFKIVEKSLNFVVDFDINDDDAIGVMNRMYLSYGDKLPNSKFTKAGYYVCGWSTEPSGEGNTFAVNGKFDYVGSGKYSFAVFGTKVKLYALWDAISYKITYSGTTRGNIFNDNPEYYTTDEGLLLSEPYWDGYIFDGWFLDAGYKKGIENIEPGTIGNITLYAKWIRDE